MDPKLFYTECNLKHNPFRPNPVHDEDPNHDIWAGYEKERVEFYNDIESTRIDQVGDENLILLYGDYGTGKSHACKWAKYQITQTKKEEFDSVAYYVKTIKINFVEKIAGESGTVGYKITYKNAWMSVCQKVIMKARFSMKDNKKLLEEIEAYATELEIK